MTLTDVDMKYNGTREFEVLVYRDRYPSYVNVFVLGKCLYFNISYRFSLFFVKRLCSIFNDLDHTKTKARPHVQTSILLILNFLGLHLNFCPVSDSM